MMVMVVVVIEVTSDVNLTQGARRLRWKCAYL